MMCYRSAASELFHDKSDVSSDSIPGASFSVSCHSGHPAHALLVTYQESKLAISIHIEWRWASSYLPRQRSPSSQVISVRLTGRPPCPTAMRRYRLLHRRSAALRS
uniref:Uncharacterized protein n=1 Tax=Oryza barthii TaxID=65489 RepID=A0A0D3HLY7_9ORYZ